MIKRMIVAAGVLFVAACGGAAPAATATVKPTSSIDSCLIGKWTSTGITGSQVVNGVTVIPGGGAGQVFTFTAAGTMTVNDSAMQPLTFTANGQLQATEKFSGSSSGTVTTSNGRLDYKPTHGSADSFSVFGPNGAPESTPDVDTGLNTSYTCTLDTSFALFEGGSLNLLFAPG
jgi:hypothetical protein